MGRNDDEVKWIGGPYENEPGVKKYSVDCYK